MNVFAPDGELQPIEKIEKAMQAIIKLKDTGPALGVLTTDNRDLWAEVKSSRYDLTTLRQEKICSK